MTAFFILIGILVICYLYGRYAFRFRTIEKRYSPNGQFITVEGIQLHYISKGEGNPVVLLHGGVLNGNDFGKVIDMAAANGFHAIAMIPQNHPETVIKVMRLCQINSNVSTHD